MLFAAARRRESQSQSEFHALESDLAGASDKSISSRIRDARSRGKLLAQLHDPKLSNRERPSEDFTARQVQTHFYARAYWENPANLADPFSLSAQPPKETWQDVTMERMALQVELLDRRSVRTASSLAMMRSALSKDVNNSR